MKKYYKQFIFIPVTQARFVNMEVGQFSRELEGEGGRGRTFSRSVGDSLQPVHSEFVYDCASSSFLSLGLRCFRSLYSWSSLCQDGVKLELSLVKIV